MTATILGVVGLSLAIAALVAAAGLFVRVSDGRRLASWAICGFVARRRRQRALSRGAGHGVWLGCVDYGHRFLVYVEDLVIVWPPRTGQSPLLADWVLSPPGVEPTASTRPDPRELGGEGGAS
jgi:hypothetical protein